MQVQVAAMKTKSFTTKFCSRIIWRHFCFILILGLSSFVISKLCLITKETEENVALESYGFHNRSLSGIEAIGKLLSPLNSSAINLARTLSSSLNGTELSFLAIQTKVAPELFLTLSMIPPVSQASYIGLNGILFSFYIDEDQMIAVFSNTSYSSEWYTQPVNRDTGKLYGEAVASSSMDTVNATWFEQALNSTSGFSWVGRGWNKNQDSLFLTAVAMDGRGVISLGVPAKVVVEYFAALDFHGGGFSLGYSKWGNGGNHVDISCLSDDGELRPSFGKVRGMKYMFFCSSIDVAGVHSVYVLAYPTKGLVSLVHENSKISFMFLLLLFFLIAISVCVFVFMMIRATRREMFLCAALVKQMDATQQAERKSMNKTTAFNRANHDVRASLVAISALTGLCHNDARPYTELEAKLAKIKSGINDLFGILNSVLDISKMEAGKIQLEVEEFDLAQLLEDVVDMFYHVAITKGNAVKFTSEGHITVRATFKKTSFENAIIASNRNVVFKCLSRLWFKNTDSFNDLDALHAAQQDPNLREFEIEVDDTGKGIPKDMQKSVFENFVQVTDTAVGQEGTGLGLGIVQSLVRLMGGDIRIVDKELGERGTCFNFNVKLPICEPEVADPEEEQPRMHIRASPSKTDGSHVVLFIAGDERRRILTKYIESLNIKVSNVKQGKNLIPHLEKIKRKLDLSYFSYSEKNQLSSVEYLGKSASSESDSAAKYEGSLSIKDEMDYLSLPHRKSSSKSSPGIILIVIDASNGGLFSELCSSVANFRKDIHSSRCKVVCLDNPAEENRGIHLFDHIISKPFHGSRLYQVLGLIPELKKCNLPKLVTGAKTAQEAEYSTNSGNLNVLDCKEHETETSTSSNPTLELQQIVVQKWDEESSEGPLSGKKLLVVDDVKFLRQLTTATLTKVGAQVEACENGKEAFDQICKILSDYRKEGQVDALPFDYIVMDCEMPVMDGYEATRLIRGEEQKYGIHIPIIALTAHTEKEEVSKTISAGMDFHLTKPLQVGKLLEAISTSCNK
ncbi:Histidine kinase CKI1 [Quillaja saponaria]|uniref:histidine kinase n=1 Tax=Quillaja saponaria TaxID=32244 RepID=A0AAD7Q1R7_QUISA|nr:Histidine kinase CKI1 [Quillaja saponaria]